MPLKYMIKKISIELSNFVKNIYSFEIRSNLEYKKKPLIYQSMRNGQNGSDLQLHKIWRQKSFEQMIKEEQIDVKDLFEIKRKCVKLI